MHLVAAPPMLVWPPILATVVPGDASAGHAHHAMHLVLALEGELSVRVGDEAPSRVAGFLNAPDVPHAIDAAGLDVVIAFVEPESEPGARLLGALGDASLRTFDAVERDALLATLATDPDADALGAWVEASVARISGAHRAEAKVHPRVRRVLRALRELPAGGDTSLDALAALAGLSPSRFMHVFTESVGIPLRPYLAWLRIQRATTHIVGGASLAQAAAQAGFSDAAHMSRTFRRTFGMTPSALRAAALSGARRRGSQPVQAHVSDPRDTRASGAR